MRWREAIAIIASERDLELPHRRRLYALSGPQFGVYLRQLRRVLAEEGLDEEAAMELVGSEMKQIQAAA